MVYKAVHFEKTAGNATADHFTHHRTIASTGSGNPDADRIRDRRSAGCRASVRKPGPRSKLNKPGRGVGAAGGAGFRGPEAASGPARSVTPDGDPVSDRNRLSAVQLHRPR